MRPVPTTIDGATSIRDAALSAFYELGYHGTSVREIAKRAGMSVAALYHHFPAKQQLLVEFIGGFMDDLLAVLHQSVAQAAPDARSRLEAAVRAHVSFHIDRQAEGFVGNAEVRSLEPAARAVVIAQRDEEQDVFERIIGDGLASGAFKVSDARMAARAIVTMCTAVLSWFVPGGGLTPDEVGDHYAALALNLVQARERKAGGGRSSVAKT